MRYMKNTVERIKLSAMLNAMHYKFNDDVITYIKSYPKYCIFVPCFLMQRYVDALALETEALKLLETDNNAFIELSAKRLKEKATEHKERMAELRVDTDKFYRDIVMHLEYSMKIGSFTSDMLKFLNELNELIKSYKDALANQKTKNRKNNGDDNNSNDLETNE